jgi:hypothetical protein
VHEDRCCNCTIQSKCKTKGCSCFSAGKPCTCCLNIANCCNTDVLKQSYCKPTAAIIPGNDESQAPVIAGDLTAAKSETDDKSSNETERESVEDDESRSTPVGEEKEEEKKRNVGDLPGAIISDADLQLYGVYGDYVHQNPGQHLDGGIADDKLWQNYWRRLIVYHSLTYDAPNGAVGRRFVDMLAVLVEGIVSRKWNAEKFIVFQMVILQRSRDVTSAKGIKDRINKRLDGWGRGEFLDLVQDTEREMKAALTSNQKGSTSEQRAKIFNQKMLRGDVKSAVRYITTREKGGVMTSDDIDEKTGDSVAEVLASKHPEAKTPDVRHLPTYSETPVLHDIDITTDVVEHVASRLTGSAGLGGSDAHAVSHWLLKFSAASQRLRSALADLGSWMANKSPPWAAIRALMAGRLLAIDKSPGIRPIGIGETWRRAIAKCILRVAGGEAKEACGIDQLCAGLESGIEGAIHAMQHMWETNKAEEEWGFLLIDAKNAFNEQNRTAMLWAVRHEWPSGARFTFNCYKHWATLVIRNNDGTGTFLYSKEGVTQGDPLSMFAYGIGLLPLIRALKVQFPEMEQTWYADDAGAGGKFDAIKRHFEKLEEIGPHYGYYPEPSKSILIVPQKNLAAAQIAFEGHEFTITTGNRYLGGFIGEREAQDIWIREKVANWAVAVEELASVAVNYPQTAYTALQRSLQQEWQFVQRVAKDVGEAFTDVEKAISQSFLPAVFGDVFDDDDPRLRLAGLPVKHAGMALPDPIKSAKTNYEASTLVNVHLLAALKGNEVFRSVDHKTASREVKSELKTRKKAKDDSELNSIVSKLPCDLRRAILRAKATGQWISAMPSTVNGTVLSAQEYRDAFLLRYGRSPGDLQPHCDGCGQKNSIRHALECKKGGNVILRHNEIRDELADLASKAIIPTAVRNEPSIHASFPAVKMSATDQDQPAVSRNFHKNRGEIRGDLSIRGLWNRGTDCIIDVRITDTDAKSNLSKDPAKVLEAHEKEKKKKYLEACLEQRRTFTPFVVSTDGLIGKEAKTLLKKLSTLLAEKWGKSYAEVCGYVNARMSIAIVRATHICLRGSRVPSSQMSFRRPQWEDKAGLSLFRH